MAVADEIRSYLGNDVGAKVGGKGQNGDATLVIAEVSLPLQEEGRILAQVQGSG